MAEQQQFLEVIDRDRAQRLFQAALHLTPLGEETVALDAALGRVLAEDVVAQVDVPSFDRSNVDGFAVRACDTFGTQEENPVQLDLLPEKIATAVVPTGAVAAGRAMLIATGGMVPRGADAVVMVEQTDTEGDRLTVRKAVTAGSGVAFAGTDVAAGETVLRAGTTLTSRETGVLAAVGVAELLVWRRPRVAVISTGDEIIAPGEPMQTGLVFDSNARILADAVRELGGEPVMLGIVHDEVDALRTLVAQALDTADVVLLSGGTSKGEGDLSYRVVSELDDPGIVAHGVALKPGKPICLAATGGKPVVILPGFPTSAIFTFHEFVAPVIRRLGGGAEEDRETVRAQLAVKVHSDVGRTEYVLVGLVHRAEANESPQGPALAAYPMGKGSGSVTTFSGADGFITVDRHEEIVESGRTVAVHLLGRDLRVADLVAIGSHCVGLDLLVGKLHGRGYQAKLLAVGSTAGLEAARRGECDVAGCHLLDAETGRFNTPFLTDELRLIEGYGRMQGVVFRTGDARFEGRTAADAVAAVRDDAAVMMVNRNQGSGTRILIDQLLDGVEPPGYAVQSRSHNAVAAAVAQGRADWGVAISTVARQAGLGFLPLTEERYDLIVPAARWDRPAVAVLRELLADPAVRDELAALGFLV